MKMPQPGILPDPLADFRFAGDWLAGRGAARTFLPWSAREGDWKEAQAARDLRPAPVLNSAAIAEIERFNSDCGNTAGARLTPMLGDSRTLAVVTGQQPNLLASPLYVLLKALSAWSLARRMTGSCSGDRPVVPIFWIASDDSDFHELRDCRLASADGRVRNLGDLATRGDAPESSPAYEWDLDSATVDRLVRMADEALSGEQYRTARALVRQALSGGRPGFESAFCRTLAALLGEAHGVIFIAPRMLWMRRAQEPLLRAEFERPGEASRLLGEQGAAMATAGYAPQIHRDKNILNAFYMRERARLRLVSRGAEAIVAENPATSRIVRRFSRSELLQELAAHPERFSPNVVTRPMVQDSVLPTIAYVGGPGEVSYLAQLAPVYAAFGVTQPAVALRASATLVPASALRELNAIGVEPRLAADPPETDENPQAIDRVLSERLLSLAPGTAPLLAKSRQIVEETDQKLAELRASADATHHPHLLPALEKTAHSVRQALDRLQGRVWRQVGNEGGEAWQCYLRATSRLHLVGPPQERVLAPHNFLDGRESAGALAAELAEKIRFDDPHPQIVMLD